MGRPVTLEDLYRLRFCSDPQLSPDGRRVAFVVTQPDEAADENRSRLFVASALTPDTARPLTNGPADSAPRWRPGSAAVTFLRKAGDAPQVHFLPMDGGEAVVVTSVPGGVVDHWWSPGGTRLAFLATVDRSEGAPSTAPVVVDRLGYKVDGSGLLDGRRSHLFVVDVDHHGSTVGEATQLTEGDWSVTGVTWSTDGKALAYVAADHDDRDLRPTASLWRIAADGGSPAVRVTEPTGSVAAPVWLYDGRILYVGKPGTAVGHARLLVVDADGGRPAELAPGFDRNVMVGAPGYPGSVPRVAGDVVLFCARDRGCTHAYRLPLSGGFPTRIAGAADRTASALSVARDRFGYVSASPTSPGEVLLADVADGGHVLAVTDFAAKALADVDLRLPEERTFTAPDGTEVHGWLIRSRDHGDGSGPSPLLLDVHGGPHNAWNPVLDGSHLYHQVLAAKGWSVLFLNPRGSDGYGEAFFADVVGGWGTADQDDFLTPIDVLVAEGVADPERVAVTGYSYGGFTTCWLTARTDRFAAAITGGCVSNLASLFGSSDAGLHIAAQELAATLTDKPEVLHAHSPITYVGDVIAPTLILHGERDDRCPIEQAEQWFAALRSREVPVRMVRYPDASHLFIFLGRPSHRVDYGRRIVDWLDEHVPVRAADRPASRA